MKNSFKSPKQFKSLLTTDTPEKDVIQEKSLVRVNTNGKKDKVKLIKNKEVKKQVFSNKFNKLEDKVKPIRTKKVKKYVFSDESEISAVNQILDSSSGDELFEGINPE